MTGLQKAKAFAPASCGNVAVGFDILGFAMDIAGDHAIVERIPGRQVIIQPVWKHPDISLQPEENTAGLGLLYMIRDLNLDFGFKVTLEKGIPLGSGMGGSAASSVAAVVAANALLDSPLTREQQLYYSLIGESVASGSFHADNVAPSLFGGMTLSTVVDNDPHTVRAISVPVPKGIYVVLVHPHLRVETKTARGILKKDIALKDHVQQSGFLATFMAGCYMDNKKWIAESLKDILVEPQRAHLIPRLLEVKEAALKCGALGCSISGAGPSVFAWADDLLHAEKIRKQMVDIFKEIGLEVEAWVAPIASQGARLL